MPSVTISRMYGSGGGEIASAVAASLGWRLVDNAFVDGIARELHADRNTAESLDEHVPTLAERIADAFAMGSSEVVPAAMGSPLPPSPQRVAEVTRRVIDQALALGPAVLVGRGAQSYLAASSDTVHVLCVSPHDALVQRVMEREHLDRVAADALVRRRNREREQWVRLHFDRSWLAPENYHLVLNTSRIGIGPSIGIVVQVARQLLASP